MSITPQKILKKIKKNELLKVGSSTSAANLLKMSIGLIVQKYIAVTLGPAGMAIIAQFQNYVSILTTISTGGIGQGIVKYTAEFSDKKEEVRKYISNALYTTLFFTIAVSVLQVIFIDEIVLKIFKTSGYESVIYLFSVTIIFFSINNVLLSILNGFREIKKYVLSNIIRSLIHLCLTLTLIYYFQLIGALWALSIIQSLISLITGYYVYNSEWFKLYYFSGKIDFKIIKNLLMFSLIGLSNVVFSPYIDIEIRDVIIKNIDIVMAGKYDSIVKLSRTYFTIFTMSLSVYYVPKMSKLVEVEKIKKEVISSLKILIPIISILLLTVYIGYEFIFQILYTKEFILPDHTLLIYLIGDLFRCIALIFGYLYIAKAKTLEFVLISITSLILKYLLTSFFVSFLSLEGVAFAHLLSLIYRLTFYIIVAKIIKIF